jgi:malic enzyme
MHHCDETGDTHSFSARFVGLVRKHFPHSLLHFEDFGVANAHKLLETYRDKHAVFNDDMYVVCRNSSTDVH